MVYKRNMGLAPYIHVSTWKTMLYYCFHILTTLSIRPFLNINTAYTMYVHTSLILIKCLCIHLWTNLYSSMQCLSLTWSFILIRLIHPWTWILLLQCLSIFHDQYAYKLWVGTTCRHCLLTYLVVQQYDYLLLHEFDIHKI